jgi:hypothetical protein
MTARRETIETLGIRAILQEAALIGRGKRHNELTAAGSVDVWWGWPAEACLLGISLEQVREIARTQAECEQELRAGKIALPAEWALGVGVGMAMREVG